MGSPVVLRVAVGIEVHQWVGNLLAPAVEQCSSVQYLGGASWCVIEQCRGGRHGSSSSPRGKSPKQGLCNAVCATTTTATIHNPHSCWGQDDLSVCPDAPQRAAADDAAGRAHQRHDRHVRPRGGNGVLRGG